MKSIAFIICLLVSHMGTAQYKEIERNPTQSLNMRKVEQYGKLKRTGFTLLGIGAVTSVVSIAMISSAEWYTDPITNQTQTDDKSGSFGLLGLSLVGVPLLITGPILIGVGKRKQRFYQSELNRLSLSYQQRYETHGFRLTYRF